MSSLKRLRTGFEVLGWIQSFVWIIGILATSGVAGIIAKDFSKLSSTSDTYIGVGVFIVLLCVLLLFALNKGEPRVKKIRIVPSLGTSTYGNIDPPTEGFNSDFRSELTLYNPNVVSVRAVNVELIALKPRRAPRNVPVSMGFAENLHMTPRSTNTEVLTFVTEWDPSASLEVIRGKFAIHDQFGNRHKFKLKFERRHMRVNGTVEPV